MLALGAYEAQEASKALEASAESAPALLERVQVDYYGTKTPINQMANIAAAEARLLSISPYDKSALPQIEKAIIDSDLGLTPNNDGNVIRILVPLVASDAQLDEGLRILRECFDAQA